MVLSMHELPVPSFLNSAELSPLLDKTSDGIKRSRVPARAPGVMGQGVGAYSH